MINLDFKAIWKKLVDNMYHIYMILTLTTALLAIFGIQDKELVYKVLIVYICVSYLILWWALYKQSQKQVSEAQIYVSRLDNCLSQLEECITKKKCNETFEQLHKAVHYARDTYRYLEACQINSDEAVSLKYEKLRFKQLLTNCLDAYCSTFNLLTGSVNRGSIKVIGHGKMDDLNYVRTLARDSLSTKENHDRDNREGESHKINCNTDYKKILERQIDYFFSNDLESEGQSYENSSFIIQTNQVDKERKWSLSYRSTLVLPIRYVFCNDDLPDDGSSLDKRRDQTIYGFLTIDSNSKNIYDKEISTQVGAILADALFPVLQSFRRKNASAEVH